MTEKTIQEVLNAGFNSNMAPISQIRAAYGDWSDMGGRKYSTVAAVADRKHQQNFLQELDYKMKDRKLYVQYSADGKNPILEPFYCEETGTKVLPNQNGYVPLTNKAIVDEEDRLEELKLEKLSKMIKRAQKSDKRACETMDIDEDLYNFMLRPVGKGGDKDYQTNTLKFSPELCEVNGTLTYIRGLPVQSKERMQAEQKFALVCESRLDFFNLADFGVRIDNQSVQAHTSEAPDAADDKYGKYVQEGRNNAAVGINRIA
jgi:hypothetical protein